MNTFPPAVALVASECVMFVAPLLFVPPLPTLACPRNTMRVSRPASSSLAGVTAFVVSEPCRVSARVAYAPAAIVGFGYVPAKSPPAAPVGVRASVSLESLVVTAFVIP